MQDRLQAKAKETLEKTKVAAEKAKEQAAVKAKETLEKTKVATEKAKEQAAEKAKETLEKTKVATDKTTRQAAEKTKETLGKTKEAAGKKKEQAAEKTRQAIPRVNLAMIVLASIGFSGCITTAFVVLGIELMNWDVVAWLAGGAVVSAIILALFLKFSRI